MCTLCHELCLCYDPDCRFNSIKFRLTVPELNLVIEIKFEFFVDSVFLQIKSQMQYLLLCFFSLNSFIWNGITKNVETHSRTTLRIFLLIIPAIEFREIQKSRNISLGCVFFACLKFKRSRLSSCEDINRAEYLFYEF